MESYIKLDDDTLGVLFLDFDSTVSRHLLSESFICHGSLHSLLNRTASERLDPEVVHHVNVRCILFLRSYPTSYIQESFGCSQRYDSHLVLCTFSYPYRFLGPLAVPSIENLVVHVKITNTGRESLNILNHALSPLNDISTDVFNIKGSDNLPLSFIGSQVSRPHTTAKEKNNQ